MTVSVYLRKMLHRKSVEYAANNPAGNTAAGTFFVSDKSTILPAHDMAFYVGGASAIWNYSADNDSWMQIGNSGSAGTFGAGACGEVVPISAPAGAITNTASAGTTTTVTTALTIVRSLQGCEFRVVAGTGVGYNGTIKNNTNGANAIITLNTASGVAFDNTTQFQFFGGSFWFFCPGSGAVGFNVYDRATNVWTSRSVTNLPTTWITEGQLIGTSSRVSNRGGGFVNGTATLATSTTLTDSGKTWPTNGFTNYQVRITAGTGIGQIRSISSNTGTALTVSTWTVTPDATSQYRIEGNDDYLYLLGNSAVTLYRYSISGNSWSTLSPGAARSSAPTTGFTASWIDAVQDADWTSGVYGNHYTTTLLQQNGRYIYSFRGAAGNVLDVYDIAGNTWISGISYGQQSETFTTGTSACDLDGMIYLQKDATARIYKFDVAKNMIDAYTTNPIPQSTAVAGKKLITTTFIEGATRIDFLYALGQTRSELVRWVMI